jgi:hypothetical protein
MATFAETMLAKYEGLLQTSAGLDRAAIGVSFARHMGLALLLLRPLALCPAEFQAGGYWTSKIRARKSRDVPPTGPPAYFWTYAR